MVASGTGITVMPATAISPADDTLLSIRRFSSPEPSRRVMLITRKQFFRRKAIDMVQQAVFQSGLTGVSMLDT